jgi:hypothetical protein
MLRCADDFVVGFQHRHDAEKSLRELKERFATFNLELHPDKTRLIEFGRFADSNRRKRGDGKPGRLACGWDECFEATTSTTRCLETSWPLASFAAP